MKNLQKSQLTLYGLHRIAQAHEGELMLFTSIGLGDTALEGSLNEVTELEGEKQRFPISGSNVSGNNFWASCKPVDINDPAGIYVRAIGLYIADQTHPNDRRYDELYAVSSIIPNFGEEKDYIVHIPKNLENAEINYEIRMNTIISPTALVEIIGGVGSIGVAKISILGLVSSTEKPFGVSVNENTGEMTVNGMEELVNKVNEILENGIGTGTNTCSSNITNVENPNTYNPGTGTGGITWTDPTVPFDHIEIIDLDTGEIHRVEKGVQQFTPEEGEHHYIIQAVDENGNVISEVDTGTHIYVYDYTANLLSAIIPMAEPNLLILTFDNFVKITDASGISVSDIDDDIIFLDKPEGKVIRLRLANEYFVQDSPYSLNYNPAAGNILQYNDAPIPAITERSIENYADFSPAVFVSAQVPQEEPQTLVLVMSRPIVIENILSFSLSGTTAKITNVVSQGATVEFSLDEPVDGSETEPDIKISFNGEGAVDNLGQEVEAFTYRSVANNSTHKAISIHSAEVPSDNSRSLIVVMEGAVKMTTAAGFSLVSPDQENLPNLSQADFTVSDGTITFTFGTGLLIDKTFALNYNGQGTLRALSNNDTVKAFSTSVINNSTDVGGIPPYESEPRNLAYVLFGREVETNEDVTAICEAIHSTIASGNIYNLTNDYFHLAISPTNRFEVADGYLTGLCQLTITKAITVSTMTT